MRDESRVGSMDLWDRSPIERYLPHPVFDSP
jgi:hypothetical protein